MGICGDSVHPPLVGVVEVPPSESFVSGHAGGEGQACRLRLQDLRDFSRLLCRNREPEGSLSLGQAALKTLTIRAASSSTLHWTPCRRRCIWRSVTTSF